jgi:membrane protease YdiL (CAAX protease family)
LSEAEQVIKRQVWGPWATVGFGLVIIIVYLITQIILGIIIGVAVSFSDSNLSPSQIAETLLAIEGLLVSTSTIASAIVGVGLIIIFVKVRKNISIAKYLALKPISIKAILVSLGIITGLIIINDTICIIIGRPVNPQVMVDTYNTSVWPVLLWIALVIFAPAFEEAFFRGFLFTGLSDSKLGVIGTIILTSLLWTLLHVQYEVFELVSIFILGIILGITRFRTRSLWAPLSMHALANVVATLEVALNVNSLIG